MNVHCWAPLLLCVVGTLYAGDSPLRPGLGEVPGTYDVRICKGSCSDAKPDDVVVRGFVVLESKEFDVAEIMEPIRSVFDYGYSWDDKPSGCFVLETLKQNRTYAGITDIGFTHWSWYKGELRFGLYSSPDAWYTTHVTMSEDGFTGQGVSSGAGVAAPPDWGTDVVVGRRTGPQDRMKCIRVAIQRLPK